MRKKGLSSARDETKGAGSPLDEMSSVRIVMRNSRVITEPRNSLRGIGALELNNPLQGLMIAPRGTGAVKTVELSTVLSSSD